MDGENNGLNPIKMDDFGGKPTMFGNIHIKLESFYFMALWNFGWVSIDVGNVVISLAVTASKYDPEFQQKGAVE